MRPRDKKIFYDFRLVDITGFHQACAKGKKLIISYPLTPSGRQPDPDEFLFSSDANAANALEHINEYCRTERTVEFVESPGGKFIAFAHPLDGR